MRANVAGLCLTLIFGAAASMAQEAPVQNQQGVPLPTQADRNQVYCSGFYTNERVPDDTRLISGEQSEYKVTFTSGDIVYLSKGSNQGVKVGDRFSVVRQDADATKVQWFKWQDKLTKAMGTHYVDLGELVVIKSQTNVAIAKVSMSCDFMQRGDIVRPFVERPAGPFKDPAQFDIFAPVSGRPVAMVVRAKDKEQVNGRWGIIYVNLGSSQGVKVGDYFRIFRYQSSNGSVIPVPAGYQDRLYGFGSNPRRYAWNDLPREVLGEGIVLNANGNSATVLITTVRAEIYAGDYVELE